MKKIQSQNIQKPLTLRNPSQDSSSQTCQHPIWKLIKRKNFGQPGILCQQKCQQKNWVHLAKQPDQQVTETELKNLIKLRIEYNNKNYLEFKNSVTRDFQFVQKALKESKEKVFNQIDLVFHQAIKNQNSQTFANGLEKLQDQSKIRTISCHEVYSLTNFQPILSEIRINQIFDVERNSRAIIWQIIQFFKESTQKIEQQFQNKINLFKQQRQTFKLQSANLPSQIISIKNSQQPQEAINKNDQQSQNLVSKSNPQQQIISIKESSITKPIQKRQKLLNPPIETKGQNQSQKMQEQKNQQSQNKKKYNQMQDERKNNLIREEKNQQELQCKRRLLNKQKQKKLMQKQNPQKQNSATTKINLNQQNKQKEKKSPDPIQQSGFEILLENFKRNQSLKTNQIQSHENQVKKKVNKTETFQNPTSQPKLNSFLKTDNSSSSTNDNKKNMRDDAKIISPIINEKKNKLLDQAYNPFGRKIDKKEENSNNIQQKLTSKLNIIDNPLGLKTKQTIKPFEHLQSIISQNQLSNTNKKQLGQNKKREEQKLAQAYTNIKNNSGTSSLKTLPNITNSAKPLPNLFGLPKTSPSFEQTKEIPVAVSFEDSDLKSHKKNQRYDQTIQNLLNKTENTSKLINETLKPTLQSNQTQDQYKSLFNQIKKSNQYLSNNLNKNILDLNKNSSSSFTQNSPNFIRNNSLEKFKKKQDQVQKDLYTRNQQKTNQIKEASQKNVSFLSKPSIEKSNTIDKITQQNKQLSQSQKDIQRLKLESQKKADSPLKKMSLFGLFGSGKNTSTKKPDLQMLEELFQKQKRRKNQNGEKQKQFQKSSLHGDLTQQSQFPINQSQNVKAIGMDTKLKNTSMMEDTKKIEGQLKSEINMFQNAETATKKINFYNDRYTAGFPNIFKPNSN